MGHPARKSNLTAAEYLRIEHDAPFRSEFHLGEMFAMAGGSPQHALIINNLGAELRRIAKKTGCFVYGSELRVRVDPSGLYTYPDTSIIAGPIEYDPEDVKRQTVTNPVLIAEVLSASTEGYDRGKKADLYRQIPSLRELLVVWQNEPLIERYGRNADDTWTLTTRRGLDATLDMLSISGQLPLAEVYDNVDFPPLGDPENPLPPRSR